MHQWSNQEKYHFFNKLMDQTIITPTKLNNNFNNSFKSIELVSLAENEAIKSFNSNNYYYLKLNSKQKSIFKKSYKEKEKKLKRKSVYKTQLGCFALFSLLLMIGNGTIG